MEQPGERLKRVRELLQMTYRDVVEASRKIAARLGKAEFALALSRLADIENGAIMPSLCRLYSQCAIYRLEFEEVAAWFGVPLDQLPAVAAGVGLKATHTVQFKSRGTAPLPVLGPEDIDIAKTTFLNPYIQRWGAMPFRFLHGLDFTRHRYGFIGLEDWSMYPLLQPGALVLIDARTRIAAGGWTTEFDRPIYFLEKRDGFLCQWCDLEAGSLIVRGHPSSQYKPQVFRYPQEIELVGQVVGIAMLLESARRGPARHPATPGPFPSP